MIDERFSNPNLRKTISEPVTEIEKVVPMFKLARAFVIWISVAQQFKRFTGHQKATGSIPVWGSENFLLRLWLDDIYR